MAADIIYLCEVHRERSIFCRNCQEMRYMLMMRDADSPPLERPDGYDEE